MNVKIRLLQKVASELAFLRKMIAQNPPLAQDVLKSIKNNKIFTSFPEFNTLLDEAISVARDNYDKFAAYCDILLEKVFNEVEKLKAMRKKFINKVLPKRQKEKRENE